MPNRFAPVICRAVCRTYRDQPVQRDVCRESTRAVELNSRVWKTARRHSSFCPEQAENLRVVTSNVASPLSHHS